MKLHPLTDLVKELLEVKQSIDRYDLAIYLGAPESPPGVFGSYCQVADDTLMVLSQQGHIMVDVSRSGCRYPYYIASDLPRGYARREMHHNT